MKKEQKRESKDKKELSLLVSGSALCDVSEDFEEIREIVEELKKEDSEKNKKGKNKSDKNLPEDDDNEDGLVDEDKANKDEKASIDQREISYAESLIYQQKNIDYEELFSYMGRKYEEAYLSEAQQFYKEAESAAADMSEEELEHIVKKEQTDIMLCKDMDRIEIEEKEKYKNWKTFNTFWNMIKIQLNMVGEGATGVFYV